MGIKTLPFEGNIADALDAPPPGHNEAVAAACGCTAREALTGPMPPGFGVMALIAAPMLGYSGDLPTLSSAMADASTEWAWRDTLLAFFPDEQVTDD